jgi:vancomycin resistance protein VanJ
MTDNQAQPEITVMTFNVGNGLAPATHLAALLRHSGADLIGLQELDAGQAEAIDRLTRDRYPHHVVRGTGFEGRGLLSRWPILEVDWLNLLPHRPDLRATIEVDGWPVTIFVAHPPPPRVRAQGIMFDPETVAQIDRLAEVVTDAAPAILIGDFNMTPRNPKYAHLTAAGLVDAFGVAGEGRGSTFPTRPGRVRSVNHRLSWVPLPTISRFDYIWHTPDLAAERAWVGRRGAGSDHLPVLARLTRTPEPE